MEVNEAEEAGYRLQCGRDVEDLWERLDRIDSGAADDHERTCPHCRGALQGLRTLRGLAGELAREDVPPPAGLSARIMAAVRSEARKREMLPLGPDGSGGVLVSEQAVAAVLRFAADRVPGVRARRCRVRQLVDVVEVRMGLAVHVSDFTAPRLEEVRSLVTAAAREQIGLGPVRLDLVVEDLYES